MSVPQVLVQNSDGPASTGPPVKVCVQILLASRPASVRVANAAAPRRYHDRWDDRHAWDHHGAAAVVRTAVVAVATAAAIWPAVKAGSTTPGDRNCQTSLGPVERGERHRLGGGKGEETDADGDPDSEKLCHSFLLSCCVMLIPTLVEARFNLAGCSVN